MEKCGAGEGWKNVVLERGGEIWCWRGMEKINWTDNVRNGEVLLTAKDERNFLRRVKRRQASWNVLTPLFGDPL